jgi:putative membrane protein
MVGPYWNYGDWPGPWHMGFGFGWIFPLLMMALLVGCAFFFLRIVGQGGSRRDVTPALDILAERFAKGEIGKEEFEEKRAVLLRKP